MRYTVRQFNEEYPYDNSCLDAVFQNRYGDLKACPKCGVSNPKFYHVKMRKSYACRDCGHQLYPLAGTIFHKSSTPLKSWFYAIYLFSVSKNGVSAKELERIIGVSYKTAHRMEKQIRRLMAGDDDKFDNNGVPKQMDEAYVGGRRRQSQAYDNKTPILGVVEKGGNVKTRVVMHANAESATKFLKDSVEVGAIVHTDESSIYKKINQIYEHQSVRHVSKQWVKDDIHTNQIEGFWSQLKRSLDGTYHAVSPYYLNSYVDEFAFRYNHRTELIFPVLLQQAVKPF